MLTASKQVLMAPVTLDVRNACAYLQISDYLLRQLVRERRIPHLRLGKRILFRQQALDAFLDSVEADSVRHQGAGGSVWGIVEIPE